MNNKILEKLKNNTLQTISELKIKPRPKWIFQIKEIIIWVVFGLSTIFGGLAFTLILHLMQRDFIPVLHFLNTHEYLLYFPFFWVFFLSLFIALSIIYWKKSDNGYKQKPIIIFFVSILTSIIIGSFLFLFQMGEPIYNVTHKMPGPFQLEKMQDRIWLEKNSNRISGEIISELEDNHFSLQNFCQKNIKEIYTNKLPKEQFIFIKKGNQVRIITDHDLNNLNNIEALAILNWDKPFLPNPNCLKK